MDESKDLIVTNYNGKTDQILIKGKLKEKIFAFIDNISDEKVDKKELAKNSF